MNNKCVYVGCGRFLCENVLYPMISEEHIEISRDFKEQVVEPILKV